MLEKIKTALRITNSSFDEEIENFIEACLQDLIQYGVDANICTTGTTDALIVTAVIFYCRWQYDFEGQGERYEKMYRNMYQTLSLRGDYNGSDE